MLPHDCHIMDKGSNQTPRQLLLLKVDGRFEVSSAPSHICGECEIVIRLHAITLNRFDVEQLETGSAMTRWPTVLGIEGSGVVERQGELVDGFNLGDEVIALFSTNEDNRSAAFQSHAVVDASMACHKPSSISFADAASLPMAFVTATRAIRKALNLPATWVGTPTNSREEHSLSPRRFFIFGCNSAVGSSPIQVLRHAFPDAKIGGTIYGEEKRPFVARIDPHDPDWSRLRDRWIRSGHSVASPKRCYQIARDCHQLCTPVR